MRRGAEAGGWARVRGGRAGAAGRSWLLSWGQAVPLRWWLSRPDGPGWDGTIPRLAAGVTPAAGTGIAAPRRRLLVGGGAAGCLSLSLNSADGRWRCGSGASTNLGGGDRADTWVSKGGGLCAGSCGVAAGAQATGMCRSTTPSTAAWASPPGSSAESASSRSEAAVLARRGASVAAGWSAGWTWHGAARVGNASLPLRVPARCRSLLWMRLLR